MANKELGEKIRSYRNNAKLTQQELADKLGLKNKSTLGSWEVGKSEPDANMIGEMLGVFGIDANTFFGWTEKQLSSPGISRETGHYVDRTTTTQLEKLSDYFKETDKMPTAEGLIDIINSLPEQSYQEVKDNLLLIKLKYHLRATDN